ncbi:MAG: aldehyde ferredoxin oxidoreductase [Candidatus Abyssobacteria bacterium SURF_5]|uniref:Aldehyde ferredoxin oxidoreductase n=1 Tax=Abyssobacteria bacterium (strain SURF_5) TaxID=2093360 RepID=A0A3A4NIX4_ABYX5|nr:MAG: aldehyde ferredoxin oxidoreductase [Candidatus Abyssubacteria bacterium SURF_5]
MALGYMGKLIRTKLTEGKVVSEPLNMDDARAFIGGAGLGTKIVYDEVPASADPLGPENKILFMTGPVTATKFPTSGRYEVCTKSPATGMWVDASSAGYWAAEFKKTGFDGIIAEGASSKPVYLWISDGKAELRDASHLWGKDSVQTQEIIQKELGDSKICVLCIGEAGEKKVLMSAVMNDEGRAAGRAGVGAVMGSKNLKAIAVRGKQNPKLANPEFVGEMAKKFSHELSTNPLLEPMRAYGTAGSMDTAWITGDIPVQNWRKGLWKEGCISIGGKKMADTILKPHKACYNCPIRCSRWIKIDEGKFKMEGPGPEYETLGSFGSMLLNDDLESICHINELCNRYGIDTISAGCAVAFAMEAYENGVITKQDTGGVELKWGNVDAIIEMTHQIGQAKGLGALLGQGVKRAAKQLGKGSEKYAIHVKGLEVPMHDPRAFHGMAVNYATSPRGACHLHGAAFIYDMGLIAPGFGVNYKQGRFDKKGKGLNTKAAQDQASFINSLVVCQFCGLGLSPFHAVHLLGAITGFAYQSKEIPLIAERITNLQRVFSLKCGVTAKDDVLPERLLTPLKEGGHAGKAADLESQLVEYYDVRGWNKEGVPTKAKLEQLGLEYAIKDLY